MREETNDDYENTESRLEIHDNTADQKWASF